MGLVHAEAVFTQRLCLHYDLIFGMNYIFILVKTGSDSCDGAIPGYCTISEGHAITQGALGNIGLAFHHLHSQIPSSP